MSAAPGRLGQLRVFSTRVGQMLFDEFAQAQALIQLAHHD
jgi:hypothetical protein